MFPKGCGFLKRDLDLIREILLLIEESNRALAVSDIRIPEYTTEEIVFHVELLSDAGYVELSRPKYLSRVCYVVQRLTMKGCDYLDSIRDERVWKDTRATVLRTVGSAPLDIIKDIAVALIRDRLNL